MKPIVKAMVLALILTPSLLHAKDEPLNFVHIIMDDLRTAGLEIHGDDDVIAPNINRLAAEGVVFERAFANFPSCGASRASLLTGLRPTLNRFTGYNARIDEDAKGVTTLPGYLKDNGYVTLSFGKVIHQRGDTDHAWSAHPWDARYDTRFIEGNTLNYLDYKNSDNVDAFNSSCKKKLICSPSGYGKGPAFEMEDIPDIAYVDGKTAVAAVVALEELEKSGNPFYIAVGFFKPHLPFTAPKKYWDMYDRDAITLSDIEGKPESAPRAAWHGSGEIRNIYSGIPGKPDPWVQNLSEDLRKTLRHGYYAATTYADAQVGKVLDALDRLELSENTVVILTGDHGFSLGDHTLWGKHSLFNIAIQSPLIVRAPSINGGERVSGVVEYIDIYPTVVEMAQLKPPAHLQGKSLVNNLHDAFAPTKAEIFVRYKGGENIRTERFSYSAWFNKKGVRTEHMLYDHENDPLETKNIVDNHEYQSVVKELQASMLEHIEKREANLL